MRTVKVITIDGNSGTIGIGDGDAEGKTVCVAVGDDEVELEDYDELCQTTFFSIYFWLKFTLITLGFAEALETFLGEKNANANALSRL